MLWGIEFDNLSITLQKVIDALTEILTKIFGFIEEEEGWEETTTEA